MEEIVNNLRRRRLWTTNILVLCLLYQLILATATSQDSVVTLNETQSELTNMESLTKEMNLLKSKLITVKNLTEHDVGIFHKGSSRSTSNITQIERKMLQIQNTIQDLSNITDHGISDLESIKERMNTLEIELEDLRRLYDNDGREVRQDVSKVESLLTNLTQTHKNVTGRLLTRINELEKKLKYLMQPEITHFYKAMEAKNFGLAADNFNKIVSKNEIVEFIKHSYEIVNNFECYMKLASQVVDCDKRQEIYSVIKDNYLLQKNESYADICRYVILEVVLSKIKNRKCNMEYDETVVLHTYREGDAFIVVTTGYPRYVIPGIETYLWRLSQRNRHTPVDGIMISHTYLNDIIHVENNYSSRQILFCDDNQIKLSEDNYVAPIDNC